MRGWVIFRYEVDRDCWIEVGCTTAVDAGAAFRKVVIKPNEVWNGQLVGEYRVLSLEDSAHLAIELNLRDLDAPANPARPDGS